MKICSNCILPETFPGIKFNESGVCNHCVQAKNQTGETSEKKEKYRRRLDDLIAEVKGKAPSYDAIMAYSGGKDSSYTLKLLKEKYDLRILALTFDNHFVSSIAWENIQTVCDSLGIDLIRFRPPWPLMKSLFTLTASEDIFPLPTLLRASALCTGCITFVKSLTIKTAVEMGIPLAAYGWSPGQAPIQSAIMKTHPAQIQQNQKVFFSALPLSLASAIKTYLIPEDLYETHKDRFPWNIHPLAFFPYDEKAILSELQGMGWKLPEDTDTNSTNCLLNAFANQRHLDRHGFHPYVLEIANMVRQGVMSREEGIEKIYSTQNSAMVSFAQKRLGL